MSILKVVTIGTVALVGGGLGACAAGFLSMAPSVHDTAKKYLGKNGVEIMVVGTAVLSAAVASAPFVAACFTTKE